MIWPFGKRYLRYRSKLEWILGEQIPTPFSVIQDRKRFDEVVFQYGELRKHLFARHLKTLSSEQRDLLSAGKHPSQDHALTQAALPYADKLGEKLRHLHFVSKVGVGTYHGNRNVLDVFVYGIDLLDRRLLEVPEFFDGFEVLILNKSKP